MNTMERIAIVKQHMKWVANITSMDPMRRADQCYGLLMGMEMALGLDGSELDELTEYWENLRAQIMGYVRR